MASLGQAERSTLSSAMGICRQRYLSQHVIPSQQSLRYLSTSLPREKRKPVYLTPKNWKSYFESTDVPPFGKKVQNKVRRDTMDDFLSKSGAKFKEPIGHGPHWLGPTPFPSNPTFKPPRPISDSTKSEIFTEFKGLVRPRDSSKKPISEDVAIRQLATSYSISIIRLKAIIRLKVMEQAWVDQKIPLQTNFRDEMERHLGSMRRPVAEPISEESSKVEKSVLSFVRAGPEIHIPENLAYYRKIVDQQKEEAATHTTKNERKGRAKSRLIQSKRPTQPPINIVDVGGTELAEKWHDTWVEKRVAQVQEEDLPGHPYTHPGPRNPLTMNEPFPLPAHLKESSPENKK